jgi:cystathionine beta-lyase
MKKDTKLVTAGRAKKYVGAVVNPAVVRASTVVFDSMAEMHNASAARSDGVEFYGRRGTSTTFAFCDAMCELEGAAGCYAYSCGTAAITSSLLSFLSAGDHLLMVDSVYQPTRDFCINSLARFGVEVSFYDPLIGADIEHLIQDNTKVIFLESPGSLTMEVQDVPSIARVANKHNVVTMIDNTYASPFNFRPLEHGIDISIHSATKYINGHSDIMLGVASANEKTWRQLQNRSYELGQCASVDDIYTSLRGLRTLSVRLRQHAQNTQPIVEFLRAHELVDRILHPALESCDGHEFFNRDCAGGSGLFSFTLKQTSNKAIAAMIDGMTHFKMGFSWGGFESLILPVDSSITQRKIKPWSNNKNMMRLHIGLEDPQDLIQDLSAGLQRFKEAL